MKSLYDAIEDFWFMRVPQRARYLLVGGFNTIVAYLIFAGLYVLTGKYGPAVVLQYIISINISILAMRRYVFRAKGNFKNEYIRAAGVYLFMLGMNYVALLVMIEIVKANTLLAQAIYLAASTIAIYLLHKYFSFRSAL